MYLKMKKSLLFIVFLWVSIAYAQILPVDSSYVVHGRFINVGYNLKYKMPNWVMYQLSPEAAGDVLMDVTRTNEFNPSPSLDEKNQASLRDFYKSGYDRGHLCPAEDMDFHVSAMRESFYYTNVAPQLPGFNRGIWARLEIAVRKMALLDTMWVVTGCIVMKGDTCMSGTNVKVPSYFYKIIVDRKYVKSVALIMPNKACPGCDLEAFLTTIDYLEFVTGIDFFSTLPKEKQEKMESDNSYTFCK